MALLLPVPIVIVRPSVQVELNKINSMIDHLGYRADMVIYADDIQAASPIIERHAPNLILYVIEDAHDVIHIPKLKQQYYSDHFIVIFKTPAASVIYSALRYGIHSYMVQEDTIPQMAETLKIALRGGAYLHPTLANYLLEQIRLDAHLKTQFTASELQLLAFVSQNLAFRDILERMQLKDFHAQNIVRKIYQKISA
ncbi:hypothetical protein A3K93_03385 [Acinetobacter sp. NCu2D-2]|nr:hypothetical protein A3K93_03385 [Acinetobacter sp. NCu2D-2]